MQPMQLCCNSLRQSEDTYEDTQWRKIAKMKYVNISKSAYSRVGNMRAPFGSDLPMFAQLEKTLKVTLLDLDLF